MTARASLDFDAAFAAFVADRQAEASRAQQEADAEADAQPGPEAEP